MSALLATQFPQWSALPIGPVLGDGWDNRSFRLGEQLLVRLPSAEAYADQARADEARRVVAEVLADHRGTA